MRDCSIHHVPGRHLTFDDRVILARDWNRLLECARKPLMDSHKDTEAQRLIGAAAPFRFQGLPPMPSRSRRTFADRAS